MSSVGWIEFCGGNDAVEHAAELIGTGQVEIDAGDLALKLVG